MSSKQVENKIFKMSSTTIAFYFLNYFIVVQVQLSAFTPYHSPQLQPSPPLPAASSPLGFVHVSFIVVSETLPPFHPFIPSHFPYGYCQIFLNFNVSGYILLACLFCGLGST